MRLKIACLATTLLPLLGVAQTPEAWQACTDIAEGAQRLACFDAWAKSQRPPASAVAAPAPGPTPAPAAAAQPPEAPALPALPDLASVPPALPVPQPRRGFSLTASEGCHDTRYSELSRFWELEAGADCGPFGIRGYRPISADLVKGTSTASLPTSENPANNATTPVDYRTTETRLRLSLRTKIAQGLALARPDAVDSLWFAYTQQSYWQIFTPGLSRPFRSTDHEPEFIYIVPLQSAQPEAWRLRLGGLGIVHQSNGQSLPLSRSWNRVYLLGGLERDRLQLHARLWHRLPEEAERDDNPRISDYIGRGELVALWHQSRENLFAVTARHPLKSGGGGSLRLEWFRSLSDAGAGPPGGLQLHTEIFTGYGDTLLDYNRRRTVFSIGLSLVEW